jgi:hypothetical protein
MVEEAGELMHVLAKQRILGLWKDSTRYDKEGLRAKLADCIGDCAIFVCSYCNCVGWDFAELMGRVERKVRLSMDSFQLCAMLIQRASTIVLAGFAFESDAISYLSLVAAIAQREQLDFEQCVRDTWNQVKERKR